MKWHIEKIFFNRQKAIILSNLKLISKIKPLRNDFMKCFQFLLGMSCSYISKNTKSRSEVGAISSFITSNKQLYRQYHFQVWGVVLDISNCLVKYLTVRDSKNCFAPNIKEKFHTNLVSLKIINMINKMKEKSTKRMKGIEKLLNIKKNMRQSVTE